MEKIPYPEGHQLSLRTIVLRGMCFYPRCHHNLPLWIRVPHSASMDRQSVFFLLVFTSTQPGP